MLELRRVKFDGVDALSRFTQMMPRTLSEPGVITSGCCDYAWEPCPARRYAASGSPSISSRAAAVCGTLRASRLFAMSAAIVSAAPPYSTGSGR
jgi:hypothetical protein